MATACLHKHNTENAPAVSHDFYMDNFFNGAVTKTEATKLLDRLIKIMDTSEMELGNWFSNDSNILDEFI